MQGAGGSCVCCGLSQGVLWVSWVQTLFFCFFDDVSVHRSDIDLLENEIASLSLLSCSKTGGKLNVRIFSGLTGAARGLFRELRKTDSRNSCRRDVSVRTRLKPSKLSAVQQSGSPGSMLASPVPCFL